MHRGVYLVPSLSGVHATQVAAALAYGRTAAVSGFEVDFHWATERLVMKSTAWHTTASRSAQPRDRRRDTALAAGGHHVLRFTWFDVTDRELATAARVAEALARGGAA